MSRRSRLLRSPAGATQTLRLQHVALMHSTSNNASCRVALAAGFAAEGTLRRCMLHADGWHDMHLHALVPDRQ